MNDSWMTKEDCAYIVMHLSKCERKRKPPLINQKTRKAFKKLSANIESFNKEKQNE